MFLTMNAHAIVHSIMWALLCLLHYANFIYTNFILSSHNSLHYNSLYICLLT